MVTGGSFFSRGSKVRYSGKVERELSMCEQQELDAAGGAGPPAVPTPSSASAVRARQAYAARRSSSLPLRDFGDDDQGLLLIYSLLFLIWSSFNVIQLN